MSHKEAQKATNVFAISFVLHVPLCGAEEYECETGIFFLTGRFHQFDEGDLSYGHISPVSAFELEFAARQTGWEVVEITGGGSLSVFNFTTLKPLKWTLALNLLRGLAYVVGKGHEQGWCLSTSGASQSSTVL